MKKKTKYDPDGVDAKRVSLTLEEKPSGVKEAKRLCQWNAASDFEAAGIYLPPGQSIEVDVKNLEGNSQPQLLVGT